MPWLIALVTSGLGAILTSLMNYFSRKAASVVLAIGAMVTLTAVFWAVIQGLILNVVVYAVVPSWFAPYLGLAVPSDFSVCLGAMVAARAARWAYYQAIGKVIVTATAV